MLSSPQASLGSLALTFGVVTGCGEPDAPTVDPGGEVGSTQQAFDQVFAEPSPWGRIITPAPSCQDDEDMDLVDQRRDLLEDTDQAMDITCSLTLEPHETIKRPLRFRKDSSGLIVDCQDQLRPPGSPPSISRYGEKRNMISIASGYPFPFEVEPDGMYKVDYRPHNILIQNCTIEGDVSITGIRRGPDHDNDEIRHTVVGSHDTDEPEDPEAPPNRDADGHPLYVARARAIAPTNILFRRVTFRGKGDTPLYVNPGVSRVTIVDSVFEGSSAEDVGIYFDAESTENTVLNSTLRVTSKKEGWWRPFVWWDTLGREQIAVDSSSYNFLVGNHVSGLNNGGFNLYRNCGERGAVRYTTPSYNVIVNNQFVYRNYRLGRKDKRNHYAVHLSSRNGPHNPRHNPYCEADRTIDVDFPRDIDTSYLTQNDNAHDNIVTNNEFLNRSPKSYLKNSSALNNFTANNREVSDFSSDRKPCFAPMSFGRVLLHGNSETFVVPNTVDPAVCARSTCNNGTLETEMGVDCLDPAAPIAVECTASQDSNGCSNVLSCPLDKRVTSVKAACNLEFSSSVTDEQLAMVPAGNVRVVRASDNPNDGKCYVLSAAVSTGTTPVPVQATWDAIESGWPVTIPDENGVRSVNVGCIEKDSNGGDCHVRAEFTCE